MTKFPNLSPVEEEGEEEAEEEEREEGPRMVQGQPVGR